MEHKNIMQLTEPDGRLVEAEVLLLFKLEENGKDYIIYTFHEEDGNHLTTIHISELYKEQDQYKLEDIVDEMEWENIKEVLRQIINSEQES